MSKMQYEVLGLDPSLSALGVAHLRCTPGVLEVEVVRWITLCPRPRSLTGERAAHSLAESLDAWMDQWGIKPHWAFRELPFSDPKRMNGVKTRCFLDGMLCRVIQVRRPGVECTGTGPTQWRKQLGIKTSGLRGPELKARMVQFAGSLWDVEFGTADAAEAALIGLAGWREIEEQL